MATSEEILARKLRGRGGRSGAPADSSVIPPVPAAPPPRPVPPSPERNPMVMITMDDYNAEARRLGKDLNKFERLERDEMRDFFLSKGFRSGDPIEFFNGEKVLKGVVREEPGSAGSAGPVYTIVDQNGNVNGLSGIMTDNPGGDGWIRKVSSAQFVRGEPPTPRSEPAPLVESENAPVLIDIYKAEDDLADFRAWCAENPAADSAENNAREAEARALEASISAVRGELLRSGARGVLRQARLDKEQVERRIVETIQRRGGASKEDMRWYGSGAVRTNRFIMRMLGGALGATAGGTLFAVADKMALFTTTNGILGGGLAAKLGLSSVAAFSISAGGGIALAALIGYLSTRGGLRASTDAKVLDALTKGNRAERINEMLVRAAYDVQSRCHNELDTLVKDAYGNKFTRSVRGAYRLCGPEVAGGIGAVVGAGAAKMYAAGKTLSLNLYSVPTFFGYSAEGMKAGFDAGVVAAKHAASYVMSLIR